MHVGFSLLTLFPGRVGGSESYARGLLGEFSRGNGPERVTVLANRHVERDLASFAGGPVALRRVRSYRAGDRNATRALALGSARLAPRWVSRDAPRDLDVLHLAVTVPVPRLDVPTVVTIHDVQPHERPEAYSYAERVYRRWAYDGAARSADLVVAISSYMRDVLVDRVGIAPERVEAIPLGVDQTRFTPEPGADDERVAAAFDLPDRFVLYPANIWPQKNHARLLAAFARVSDPTVHLMLTGETYGRLGALLDRAGSPEGVRHLGHLSQDQLAVLLRRATALIFPSLYEGFGLPPLEAMACGCPVASSFRGSLAEVCGDAALELDPDDPADIAGAIERVTGDDDLRRRLRAAGLERARAFSWERTAALHVAAYRRAAG